MPKRSQVTMSRGIRYDLLYPMSSLVKVEGITKRNKVKELSNDFIDCAVSNVKINSIPYHKSKAKDEGYFSNTKIKLIKRYPNIEYSIHIRVFKNTKKNLIKEANFIIGENSYDNNFTINKYHSKSFEEKIVYIIKSNDIKAKFIIDNIKKDLKVEINYKYNKLIHNDGIYDCRIETFEEISSCLNKYIDTINEIKEIKNIIRKSKIFPSYRYNEENEKVKLDYISKILIGDTILIKDKLYTVIEIDIYDNLHFMELDSLMKGKYDVFNKKIKRNDYQVDKVLFNIFDCLFINRSEGREKREIELMLLDMVNYSRSPFLYESRGYNNLSGMSNKHLRTFYKLIKTENEYFFLNNNTNKRKRK